MNTSDNSQRPRLGTEFKMLSFSKNKLSFLSHDKIKHHFSLSLPIEYNPDPVPAAEMEVYCKFSQESFSFSTFVTLAESSACAYICFKLASQPNLNLQSL